MTRQAWLLLGIGVAAAGLAVVAALRWVPDVPDAAASVPLARTELSASVPAGSECLERIEREAGYLDACWHAQRETADEDPEKDYYQLVVFGTFGPVSSGSPRWARLVADLDGQPAGNVLMSWPTGTYDGPCRQEVVSLGVGSTSTPTETICGHIAASEPSEWANAVTWACRGCLLPDDRDRAISLYVTVGVPEGSIPTWEIFADVGG